MRAVCYHERGVCVEWSGVIAVHSSLVSLGEKDSCVLFRSSQPWFCGVLMTELRWGGYEVVVREPHAVPILILAALLWNT